MADIKGILGVLDTLDKAVDEYVANRADDGEASLLETFNSLRILIPMLVENYRELPNLPAEAKDLQVEEIVEIFTKLSLIAQKIMPHIKVP